MKKILAIVVNIVTLYAMFYISEKYLPETAFFYRWNLGQSNLVPWYEVPTYLTMVILAVIIWMSITTWAVKE